jgi:hypothetical protein
MCRYYVLDTPPCIHRAFALLCSALFYRSCSFEMLVMLVMLAVFAIPTSHTMPPLYPALRNVPLDDRNSTHVARIGRAIQQRDD